jgi:hypothetical protein
VEIKRVHLARSNGAVRKPAMKLAAEESTLDDLEGIVAEAADEHIGKASADR